MATGEQPRASSHAAVRGAAALFGIAAVWAALAAQSAPPGDPAATTDVPYRTTATMHILVRVKLDGKGPFNLIVDTGAPAMFLSTEAARRAGLEVGDDGWLRVKRMEMEGGATLENAATRVADLFQLRAMNAMGLPGKRLDGVLGYNILAAFRITYDPTSPFMQWERIPGYSPPLPRPLGGGNESENATAPASLELLGSAFQIAGKLMGRPTEDVVPRRGVAGVLFTEDDGAPTVDRVLQGSAAEAAALKSGDVIVKWNRKPVRTRAELMQAAASARAGVSVAVDIDRDGESATINLTPQEGL